MSIDWSRRKYTEEEFLIAWKSSNSFSEIARKLGVWTTTTHSGGPVYTIKKTGIEMGLSMEHFDPYWSVRKINPNRVMAPRNPPRPLAEVLVSGRDTSSNKLKYRLIREGVKEYRCEICGIEEWLGQPVPITLDHINGDHLDNRLENLRILCRNCDGLLPTFGGKNRKHTQREQQHATIQKVERAQRVRLPKDVGPFFCPSCGAAKNRKPETEHCVKCYVEEDRIVWPDIPELTKMVQECGMVGTGKKLGVTDSAVKKRLRTHGDGPYQSRDIKKMILPS